MIVGLGPYIDGEILAGDAGDAVARAAAAGAAAGAGGEMRAGDATATGGTWTVTDPATGSPVARVAAADATMVDRAVRSAAAAMQDWRRRPPAERAACLGHIAAGLRAEVEPLARSLVRESGKPLAAARREVLGCAETFDHFAAEALRLRGEALPSLTRPDERLLVVPEPVGVVAAIAPFNYPLTLLVVKLAPALAAGCAVVAKPAPETPVTTLRLAALARAAGLPPGVCNVVTGGGEVGAALVQHPLVRKVSFTGGTAAGRRVAAAAAGDLKRLTLELGGQSPALVAADVDVDRLAPDLAWHSFENAGQFCYRVAHILVERDRYEPLVAALAAAARAIPAGPGLDPAARIGPLRTRALLDKVERHVEDAVARGARVVAGGRRLTGGAHDRGYFFPPTVLAGIRPGMLVMQEETFGPVLGVMPVDSLEAAVTIANASPYGLAAYVFCRDLARAWRLADGLEAGTVMVNTVRHTERHAPFGGVKASGMGREKGRHGLAAFVEWKTVYLGLGAAPGPGAGGSEDAAGG